MDSDAFMRKYSELSHVALTDEEQKIEDELDVFEREWAKQEVC
jgi:hypothetical protein